ncbi:MFS transporter [Leptospira wolffii]|uniref:peptide MFS transporter n=1 Tax=Leptospira wolffii TaxID=409998 RepID=UPI0003451929|nr:peptide MFS transporter [Leptospira wolffii]TGK56727.1 MFS transporter [Leptospira wolffii]TGK71691.1 MFS transporter [Leptospira wolffii]TGK75452.1 MFS transporter [Leptospira wolffii]TGL33058.1 MFS transporter [Leptospira wolffii]
MEVQSQGTTIRHPRGLYVLFFVEMWERFSFYGMRALLVLFLTKAWLMADAKANLIYSFYNSLVYFTPILGGYLADRTLGYRKSIFLGGFLIMMGHLSLSLNEPNFFYTGLGFLILGNGFFKPCISTVVGKIYELEGKEDLKDSGFTIFYFGINAGAVLGTWACANLAEYKGWHYGFGVAAFGMLLGLLIFWVLGRRIDPKAFSSVTDSSSLSETSASTADPKTDREKILAILVFSAVTITFWASFEQMGSTMNLIIDRYVDRNVFGWEIPAANYQSLNPIFVMLLSLLYSWAWKKSEESGIHVSSVTKFCLGLVVLALGFLLLSVVTAGSSEKISSLWIVLGFFLLTSGELFVSPVGLSLVTKLAPVRIASMMMGIWFLATVFGHSLAGFLALFMGKQDSLSRFFLIFFSLPTLTAICLFLFRKKLESWMHGNK